jgi:cyclophilin family peptidyl-prolyl cis-trans isomerase
MFRSVFLLFALVSLVFAQAPAPAAPAAREPGLYAIFNTSLGTFVAQLFEKETPVTVKNFVALARGAKAWTDPKTGQKVTRPLYNGITFHRVIPGFMIQTGDPTGTGSYSPGWTIPDEFVPTLKFDQPGRLGMANIGERNTGNVQFFITDAPTPHLNGHHTIFGQVVEGMDVVKKIASVPRDANDKPRTPVRIITLTIKREGPPPAARK